MRLIWFDGHRRFRDDLSAYIDGELPRPRAADLEAHLAVCEACGRVLEDLRATVLTLAGLPEVAPPRSFALTPEQAARPAGRRPVAGLPAVTAGLRLAGAGLAVALAVVLIVDLAGSGGSGGNGAQTAAGPAALQMQEKSADTSADRGAPPPQAAAAPASTPAIGAVAGSVGGGEGGGGGTSSGGGGPDGQVFASPPTPPPGVIGSAATVTNGLAVASPSALSYQPATAQSEGGIDVLRVMEIGLAITVVAAVVGSFVLARTQGRRGSP